jgi:hypothetical protein
MKEVSDYKEVKYGVKFGNLRSSWKRLTVVVVAGNPCTADPALL